MALDAVVSVIIQKLRDMVAEESITLNKVIGTQLKEMQEALEKMQGFFIDASDKETNVEAIKKWTDEYLQNLYSVEDAIESFALRITRQRKRMGFLMNHALFLKNFTACKMLSRKLVKIQREIDFLNDHKPVDVEDASLRSRRSQQNDERNGAQIDPSDAVSFSRWTWGYDAGEIHEEEKTNTFDYAEFNHITQSARHSSSNISSNEEDSPKRILTTYSNDMLFPSNTSIIQEVGWQHSYQKPSDDDEASVRSRCSQPNGAQIDLNELSNVSGENREENAEVELYTFGYTELDDLTTNARHRISTSSVTEDSRSKALLRSFSNVMTFKSEASFIRERWQQAKLIYNSTSDEQELYIVGFRQDVRDLVNRLIKEDSGGDRIISLVGELGSGKTTLARAVYGNRIIKDYFKSSGAWVTISKESSTADFLRNLLKQVGESKDQGGVLSEQMLQTRVWERLRDRKYLIVLDGVGSVDVWENIKNVFPDDKNGSKIILTTCDIQVAEYADPNSHPHYMKKIDNQDSWKLFLNKVGLEESEECSTLKEKIIEICNGLPLKIVLLGSLLSTKKAEGYDKWASILDSQEHSLASDTLSFCYNDLDAHSKLCLLYLMLFPQEYDIPIRRVLRLWLAEGFVKRPEKQDMCQEITVQEYFDNLVKRSLIQISKLRSDGSPRKCRLLGVLRDYLLDKARDICLFHVHRNLDCHEHGGQYGKRRLVEYADAKNCLDRSQFQHLRSYISFNTQKKDIPAKEVGNLLSNTIGKGFGLLRVLDLEGVYKPSLPDNLGDLFHLRYLGLRWTFLDKLPKSVGDLTYLETLDLKHTYINRIPTSIWKLKHLRHLNLNEIRLDKDMPLHLSDSLPPLLTLWGLSVDSESPVKKCLSKLTQLRELGISFRLSNFDDHSSQARNGSSSLTQFKEDLLDWISKLTTLQSLRLRSKDDMGYPSELSLKPLSSLEKLSNLNLLGKLQKLPEIDQFPPNIKVLTLSVSHLVNDPMPILGQLPSLTVLRLLANSFSGREIVCPQGTFKELRVLYLWMLKDLKEWKLEEGAMEKLKELNIRCCSNLNNIPDKLLQQRTFKDLILTNMPGKFKEDIEKNYFGKVSITVNDYKFTPLPWEQADDSPNGVSSSVYGYSNGEISHN
ncbi:disease resistance protein RPP13-like [Forsythia ovata]|uniref:Disease resistance protein RPP13-like n=1 Tax=Forsythia ovata TaxID=205694 RepID=A0ABD1UXF7_9LAMI